MLFSIKVKRTMLSVRNKDPVVVKKFEVLPRFIMAGEKLQSHIFFCFILNWKQTICGQGPAMFCLYTLCSAALCKPTQAKIQMLTTSCRIFTIHLKSFGCFHWIWCCTGVTNPCKEEVNTFFCSFFYVFLQ